MTEEVPSVSVGDETKSLLHGVQGSGRRGDRKEGVRRAGAEPEGSVDADAGSRRGGCARTPGTTVQGCAGPLSGPGGTRLWGRIPPLLSKTRMHVKCQRLNHTRPPINLAMDLMYRPDSGSVLVLNSLNSSYRFRTVFRCNCNFSE